MSLVSPPDTNPTVLHCPVCGCEQVSIGDGPRRSFGWLFWISAVLLFLILLPPLNSFPPRWYERRGQRQKVAERIQEAGGWQELRRECIAFAQTNEVVQWSPWRTNDTPALPPAISALQPQQVTYFSPKIVGPDAGGSPIPLIRIKLFGMHSTGGHSTPYFGLAVVATPSNDNYTPKILVAQGHQPFNYRKVSEGVYEIY